MDIIWLNWIVYCFLLGLDVIVQSTEETEEAVASLKNIAAAHFIIVLAITGKW